MTIKDVAEHLGISWDVVKEISESDLQAAVRQAAS